ncbi:glycosyltransferase family 9 protein [Sphingomonas arantia]|uniref:Glycosyltransferase family 9 protein n=1 Tax=Sphingomonas arantia TaxID=1460676 RepID=A0ABW4TYB6_9SPHN
MQDQTVASDNVDEVRDRGAALLSFRLLQDIVDYRAVVREWHARLRVGDYLIIAVPHFFLYNRQLALPSKWLPAQRRLYSPGSLLTEIEEALAPDSYRVRWLGDLDDGYDHDLPPGVEPQGASDIAVVIERTQASAGLLPDPPVRAAWEMPQKARVHFDTERTRIEREVRSSPKRILIMKLDHLGDLIMGIPALELARRYFSDARIDLVVGSWNKDMAAELGVADRIIAFDAFPRNSTEEEPNVEATLGLFRASITDQYDLAIDLRADIDTRVLLRAVKASIKAGIGTRGRFPFLDIALPLDSTRNEAERARDDTIGQHGFAHQGSARRTHFGLHSDKETVERDCAILWGPYIVLEPGDYVFDFYLDLEDERGDGLLHLDVALNNGRRVAEMFVSGPGNFHLRFRVDEPGTTFEARIFTVDDHPSISFSFYGGRLIKQAPGNVLHQSEYAALLIEFVKMRVQDFGAMQDVLPG